MEDIAAALGEASRWRLVELLADRPRSVGELADLTGLRQPQTTKHLQTLARAGLVTAYPLGQRRVYAVEPAPLAAFGRRLTELAGRAEHQAGNRDVLARYRDAIATESRAAAGERWADGRVFEFTRTLPASRRRVWQHWVDPDLLAAWWSPPSLTVTEAGIDAVPGGRVVLSYRDADGDYHSHGRVEAAQEPDHLVFDLSVLDGAGAVAFTGHYDVTLAAEGRRTRLQVRLGITESTVGAVSAIAGIELGWGQVLDRLDEAVRSPRRTRSTTTTTSKNPRSRKDRA